MENKIKTPTIDHISFDDYKFVYEPAEDSFFLLDTLESELDFLQRYNPRICLEIGCGSGIIISALAQHLPKTICFATDINRKACEISRKTAKLNLANVEIITMDLLTMFACKKVDILIFNPPYVVTTSEELQEAVKSTKNDITTINDKNFVSSNNTTIIDGDDINNCNIIKSWAGGINGREVIDKIIFNLDNILSENGIAYILVIKENQPQKIIQELAKLHYQTLTIAERKIRGEHLYILKISKYV